MHRTTIPLRPAMSPAPLPRNGKRFHVWTIGCQMNEADSAKIAATLQEAGYTATSDEQDADIVILNSCVVRQAAEDKVAGKLNSLIRLKRERPDVAVVLTGCMVTNQQERLRERFPHVDLFFDPSDFARLEKVAPEVAELSDDLAELPHYYADPAPLSQPPPRSFRSSTAATSSAPTASCLTVAARSAAGRWPTSSPRSSAWLRAACAR